MMRTAAVRTDRGRERDGHRRPQFLAGFFGLHTSATKGGHRVVLTASLAVVVLLGGLASPSLAQFRMPDYGIRINPVLTQFNEHFEDHWYAFVANQASNDVTAIDLKTHQVAATVWVGNWPSQIAAGADRPWVFVSHYGGDKVSVINAKTLQKQYTITVGGGFPDGLAVHPDGECWVAHYGTGFDKISRVQADASSASKVGEITNLGLGAPYRMAFNQDGSRAYVTCIDTDSLCVITGRAPFQKIAEIPVGQRPDDVAVDPVTGDIYVSVWGSVHLDRSFNETHPNGKIVVIGAQEDPSNPMNDVYRIKKEIPIGQMPGQLAFDEVHNYGYVVLENQAGILSNQSWVWPSVLWTQNTPTDVAIHQKGAWGYVTEFDTDTVRVFDRRYPSWGFAGWSIPVGDGPVSIAIGVDPGVKLEVSDDYRRYDFNFDWNVSSSGGGGTSE